MPTIYGSSRLINPNIIGITGNTGPTGSTGSSGNSGGKGNTGNTGNTGANVIGMTLSGNNIITEFSDGSFRSGTKILGQTGNYVLFADGSNISSGVFDIFAGLSQESINNTIVSSLNIRGFTTASQNSTTKTIEIVSDENNKVLGISYNLRNLSYIGISSGSEPQLLVYENGFRGLTGTAYDKNTDTVDFQVTNYGERVHFVSPIRKDIGGNNAIYFYWPIDWKQGNIFKLGSYADQIPPGKNTIAQILLIENPVDTTNAYGITVIIPPGITSSNTVYTGYATTTNISSGITLAYQNTPSSEEVDFSSVSWPLGYAPCLTSNTDVITSVFIDGIWYSNFGVYNKPYTSIETINIDEVEIVESYFNCAGSQRPDNQPPLSTVNCCDTSTGNCIPNTPIGTCPGTDVDNCANCQRPPVIGLCCEICTGVTSSTTQSGCTSSPFYTWSSSINATCNDPDGPNPDLGICCYKIDSEINKYPSLIPDCECIQLAGNIPTNRIWTKISNCNKNINSIDCTDAFAGNGSCCDGNGNCTKTNQQTCASQSKYFNGIGTVCTYSYNGTIFERCKTGTGGCCLNGSCIASSSNDDCAGLYYGCGTQCINFTCTGGGGGGTDTQSCCTAGNCLPIPSGISLANCTSQGGVVYNSLGCGGLCSPPTTADCVPCQATETNTFIVPRFNSNGTQVGSIQLKVGDFFAGGIVAGVFNPNGATCLGNRIAHGGLIDLGSGEVFIGDIPDNTLLNSEDVFDGMNKGSTETILAQAYKSVYSPDGYGFTLPDNHNKNCDSWLLIVSPFPTMIDMHNIETNDQFAVRPRFTIESDTSQSAPSQINGGLPNSPHGDNFYHLKKVNTFVFSAGNTSFCPVFNDTIQSNQLFSATQDVVSPCSDPATIPFNRNYDDGGYGTLPTFRNGIMGSTYWGNTTTFDSCDDVVFCIQCQQSPSDRSALGSSIAFSRNTGYFHRNWGIRNCCRLFSSDMAIYYLRGNIGNSPTSTNDLLLQRRYKDPYSGFTYFFNSTGNNSKTTIAEAASVYNGSTAFGFRINSPTGYLGPNADGILYTNPGYYGSEYMRDQGYPQVSRWYVPSIDELAFIAHQCQNAGLQSLIEQPITVPVIVQGANSIQASGIRIGNYNNSFIAGASGWVWSSTGTFNEGITAEYIQATGGIPFVNSNSTGQEVVDVNSALYAQQVLRKQFSKAWAMKFAAPGFEGSIQYRLRKFSDTDDKAEVRLVRMIRCDNRYFKNEGTSSGAKNTTTQSNVDEALKNNCWAVPRLTASAIVNGSEQYSSSSYNLTNRSNTRNTDFKFTILNSPP